MTQEQFQDVLGMIDDDLIESVDKLRQERNSSFTENSTSDSLDSSHSFDPANSPDNLFQSFRKKIIRREAFKWGSLAASFCLLIGIGFFWTVGGKTTADLAGEAEAPENLYSQNENAGPMEDVEHVLDQKSENSSSTTPETSPSSLSSPPNLYVLTGEGDSIQAMTGTYSWQWPDNDGSTMFVEADSYHPLQSQEYISLIETAESSLQLQFDTSTHGEPYHLSVQCWSDAYWNQIDVEGQSLAVYDNCISLMEGSTIYMVTAKWTSGIVRYAFYVCYTPDPS